MTPTSERLALVLKHAWMSPFSTKSNFARANADAVAMAASADLITTQMGPDTFGTTWLITNDGMEKINEHLYGQ